MAISLAWINLLHGLSTILQAFSNAV